MKNSTIDAIKEIETIFDTTDHTISDKNLDRDTDKLGFILENLSTEAKIVLSAGGIFYTSGSNGGYMFVYPDELDIEQSRAAFNKLPEWINKDSYIKFKIVASFTITSDNGHMSNSYTVEHESWRNNR